MRRSLQPWPAHSAPPAALLLGARSHHGAAWMRAAQVALPARALRGIPRVPAPLCSLTRRRGGGLRPFAALRPVPIWLLRAPSRALASAASPPPPPGPWRQLVGLVAFGAGMAVATWLVFSASTVVVLTGGAVVLGAYLWNYARARFPPSSSSPSAMPWGAAMPGASTAPRAGGGGLFLWLAQRMLRSAVPSLGTMQNLQMRVYEDASARVGRSAALAARLGGPLVCSAPLELQLQSVNADTVGQLRFLVSGPRGGQAAAAVRFTAQPGEGGAHTLVVLEVRLPSGERFDVLGDEPPEGGGGVVDVEFRVREEEQPGDAATQGRRRRRHEKH